MKDFLCVRFLVTNTNDIVCKNWMVSPTQCRWPNEGANIQDFVQKQKIPEKSWKTYYEILCQASKKNNQ